MRNKKIVDSWGKIEPSGATHRRILDNILRKGHEIQVAEASASPHKFQHAQQERKDNMHSPFWKIFAPIAACVIIALVVAVPLLMNNPDEQVNDMLLVSYLTDDERRYETEQYPGDDYTPYIPIPAPADYELILNEVFAQMSSPTRTLLTGYWHDLSPRELPHVLPDFGFITTAVAVYSYDGTLLEVVATILSLDTAECITNEEHNITTIFISPTDTSGLFFFNFEPTLSYVYGVPVTAGIFNNRYEPYDDGLAVFTAAFELGGVYYGITLQDFTDGERGSARLAEKVSAIIRNGPANFDALEVPVIPELRHDEITLAEAQADLELGAFLPTYIPAGLSFGDARRIVNQMSSSLHANWHQAWESSISWSINATFSDLWWHQARIVSVHEPEKFDVNLYTIPWMDSVPDDIIDYLQNPIFLAEEITLDVVRARAIYCERAGNWSKPIIIFSVMFDEVAVTVSSSGLSADVVWRMLEGLL